MMENKFYTYFHINPVKQEIFYVGKGHDNRAYDKTKKSKLWKQTVKKYGIHIIIIHFNLPENEAFRLERMYIKQIGRMDLNKGTLVNLTNGGEGNSGGICSKET